MIQLRDYQQDLIARTRAALAKNKRVIMTAPTGAGKTALACHMIASAVENGHRCMFLVHQNELVKQTSAALWQNKIPHGLIVSGRARTPHAVQVASIMTLKNRLDAYESPQLVVVDETHRAAAKVYQDILAAWPDAYVVGLTATPQRTDGKGLDSVYSDIVKGPSIRYLIDHGHLCDYELYGVPQKMDLEGVRTTAGDYNKGDLEKAADKPEIVGDAVDHYLKIAKGRRCVVMCVSIKHAESVAAQYRAAGVPAAALHGLSDDRDSVLDKFESGELMVVASVQLLVEGVDLPAIGCVQWLRPTKSLVIWMQGNGRGLRPHASKDRLIILDHVQNYARHGLPDMEREWSLEGNKKQGRSGDADPDIGVQVCESCFFSFRTGVSVCPHCGSAVELKERKLEVVDGELERIQKAQAEEQARIERRKEQGKARELEELVAVGVERGMRRPDVWGANVWAARQKRKPSAADYARAAKAWRALV